MEPASDIVVKGKNGETTRKQSKRGETGGAALYLSLGLVLYLSVASLNGTADLRGS